MKFIGITGGVGAGKSEILNILSQRPDAVVVRSDERAHELMRPGSECNRRLCEAFADDPIFAEDGSFQPKALAQLIFSDEKKRALLDSIVHPAVKEDILKERDRLSRTPGIHMFFLEAALLIEDGYRDLCDELWYIYASEETRRERLRSSRGYSDEKIDAMIKSQLSEEQFRAGCDRVIDNDRPLNEVRKDLLKMTDQLEREDTKSSLYALSGEQGDDVPDDYVFGLDIGTRNVVGTVGYPTGDGGFEVIAQCSVEHDTRSMLDGQIHDIGRVGETIRGVRETLEAQTHLPLPDVCIAAAGRVLRTVTTRVEYDYPEETIVTGEDLNTLDLMGIDQAQRDLSMENNRYRFYCVGYSVMKYYLNGERFSNLEGHKAERIEEVIIVTFLPEDVVDGLYSAVERAGMQVANLTLEPIAAINVAIPENFRMLNIALVDVGAGTSDICITRDGSIIAYGMIPYAGDELTEVIVQEFLVDFATAESIKKDSTEKDQVTFKDIMGIEHTIPSEDVWKLTDPVREKITTAVAEKIKELNGDKSVAAAFVVGGGGKVHGFTDALADKLGIVHERVALRGEEVLTKVHFRQKEIKKDPLLVTPIGICLNYYEQKNSFIMIRFNGEMMKLYDNGHLKVVDAALAAGYTTDQLFPRRGKEIQYTVNGETRMARGTAGEAARILMNGAETGLNSRLEQNAVITVEESTIGSSASLELSSLPEYTESKITFIVNGRFVTCPKFVEVNGSLEPPTYQIQDGDAVETRSYYTVGQLAEFMDVAVSPDHEIIVNNRSADLNTLVYENFTVEWTVSGYGYAEDFSEESKEEQNDEAAPDEQPADEAGQTEDHRFAYGGPTRPNTPLTVPVSPQGRTISVTVNDTPIELTGANQYFLAMIFNYYSFDMTAGKGKKLMLLVNGKECGMSDTITDKDSIKVYWKDPD